MGEPAMWAEEGGLIGLVVLALFVVLIFVVRSFLKFLREMMADHRAERIEDRETRKVSDTNLAEAMRGLTDHIRSSQDSKISPSKQDD